MAVLDVVARRLQDGASFVTCRPRGHSMEPLIRSGQEVTLYPVSDPERLEPGRIVLARVHGRLYLHKILAVDQARERVQIGNNKGGVNGWTGWDKVYGMYTPERAAPEMRRL